MAKAEIELAKKEASQRIAAANRRHKEKMLQAAIVRKGTNVSTAALYGTLNRFGVPVTLGGFPWKLGVWTISTIGEALTKGNWQAALAGVSDSTQAIYVERSISTGTVIAGNADEDDGDSDDGGELD